MRRRDMLAQGLRVVNARGAEGGALSPPGHGRATGGAAAAAGSLSVPIPGLDWRA